MSGFHSVQHTFKISSAIKTFNSKLGMVVHTFNVSNQRERAGGSLILRLAWNT